MTTNKKRGLGHGLSEIVENRKSPLPEQQAKTKQILSQFQGQLPKEPNKDQELDQITQIDQIDTGIQQIPVSENTVINQIPVFNRAQSQPDTSIQQTPVSNRAAFIEPETQYFKTPNIIGDQLLATLDPYEFKIYFRLFRLSHGFRKTQCFVGYTSLAEGCGLSIAQIKRVVPQLIAKGLIKIIQSFNTATKKGTVYEIYTGIQQTPVSNRHQYPPETGIQRSPTKEDHDDLKRKDHHQSEHKKATMTTYQTITGNNWSKADQKAYEKISTVSTDAIEQAIRLACARASSRPGSLAYFVKEILATANPAPTSRAQRRRELEQIVARVRTAHAGQAGYTIADFAGDVKDCCAREGVVFDAQLFNEILG